MLLQFSVENMGCFAEEAHFSMVASADESHPEQTLASSAGQKPTILRAAALYGANGHGKSKWIEALQFAQQLIVQGTRPGQPLATRPFRLSKQHPQQPSRFEFVIDYQDNEYSYGFVINNSMVLEEWCFARPKGREVKLFERLTDTKQQVTVEAGAALVGRSSKQRQFIEFVAQGTRANQLFLTEAVARNVEPLRPLYQWFQEVLTIVSATGRYQPLEIRASREEDFLALMGDFLARAGTGIAKVIAVSEPFELDSLAFMSDSVQQKLLDDIQKGHIVTLVDQVGATFTLCKGEQGGVEAMRLQTIHQGVDGVEAQFDFEEESAGTQRLMEILPMLADVRAQEKVYLVDELDRKLHPLLSRFFVESYLHSGGNQPRGQLIFTTHDDNLLDLALLRRDEIWFIEKSPQGASTLYSLADLKIRPDLKVAKSYLLGRFGAVPKIVDGVADCRTSSLH